MYCRDTPRRGKHLWSLLSASEEGNKQVFLLLCLALPEHKVSTVLALCYFAPPMAHACLAFLVLTSATVCKICWKLVIESLGKGFSVNIFKARLNENAPHVQKDGESNKETDVTLALHGKRVLIFRCLQSSEMLSRNTDFHFTLARGFCEAFCEAFTWIIEDSISRSYCIWWAKKNPYELKIA